MTGEARVYQVETEASFLQEIVVSIWEETMDFTLCICNWEDKWEKHMGKHYVSCGHMCTHFMHLKPINIMYLMNRIDVPFGI